MGFFSFNKQKNIPQLITEYDVHAHLIPGIDDGAATIEESVEIIRYFVSLGYKHLTATPHVMGDFYKNTDEEIVAGLESLKQYLIKENITIDITAAAEYYIDEWFMERLRNKQPFLTFGGSNNYILVETSFMNKPPFLEEAIFLLNSHGYKPVLAHPERYTYLYDRFESFVDLRDRNLLFQVNLLSFIGYYSPVAEKFANKLLASNMIDFIGTDCHKLKQLQLINDKVFSNKKLINKLNQIELKNNLIQYG